MISYGYRCCKTQSCVNTLKTNDQTENGGGYGKIYNLDQQTVACKNEGLSSLKLDRDMTRWNYKYDCCKLGNKNAELDCYNANTGFLSDMGGSVLSLLNQEISCKCDDYYITDFKMNRNYNGNKDHIRYDFQCCRITSAPCNTKECQIVGKNLFFSFSSLVPPFLLSPSTPSSLFSPFSSFRKPLLTDFFFKQ